MAATKQYGDLLRAAQMSVVSPIPRNLFEHLTDDELGDEMQRLYAMRKAQNSARIAMDMRLLRWFDPEKLQDQWSNMWTGRPLPKLYHSGGLAVDIANWTKPVLESLVGLIAGYKPAPYMLNVPPEDPATDASILHADIVEKLYARQIEEMRYWRIFTDHITNVIGLGRGWKYVYWNDDKKTPVVEPLWSGHVAGFWQTDRRTLEQVIVARELTAGEAIDLYPKYEQEILQALRTPDAVYGTYTGSSGYADSQYRNVMLLTQWYRNHKGGIGMNVALANDNSGRSERGTLMLDRVRDSKYEDIPLTCTPRFKIPDKTPDDATGILMDIAPLNTQYNEVFSAWRDMLWRAIYQRYKAKGFTYRNGPRMVPGTGMYALPRADQDIARIEEIVNEGPIIQFINKLEEMIIIHPGLNRYFLNSTPPSETSGAAIGAAIKASIVRLEPQRTNIQTDELWQFSHFMGLNEAFGHFTVQGRMVDLSALIENKRRAVLTWTDVAPQEETKVKQMALAARAAGLISDDTAMDAWNIVSKTDERRKIRKERMDSVLHPEHVSQTAAALVQQAQARASSAPPPPPPPPQVRISLAGALSPEEVQAAATMVGIGGAAPQPVAGGSAAIPGRQPQAFPGGVGNAGGPPQNVQGRANEAARTAAAQSAPPASEGDNQSAPPTGAGQLANAVAPPPPGQTGGRPLGG